jgi:hypothetical protein
MHDRFKRLLGGLFDEGSQLVNALSKAGPSGLLKEDVDRSILQSISVAYVTAFHGNPLYPEFVPFQNNVYSLGCPNPDFVYGVATVEGTGIYRLSGTRGTVRRVVIQTGTGRAAFVDKPGPHLDYFTLDELSIGDDGRFSVILSMERPDQYTGDWRRLDPNADYIDFRQCAYDWINEIDARIAIERLDTPITMPRMSGAEIENKLVRVLQRARTITTFFPNVIIARYKRTAINDVECTSYDYNSPDIEISKRQIYFDGMYSLRDDEALVFDIVIPSVCEYWSCQLYNELWSSIDYVHRQSSLNGHTAYADSQRTVQIVLSAREPNIVNWLDISDYPSGGVMFRFTGYSENPVVKCHRVNFVDLKDHLRSIPRIGAEQRVKLASERRVGAQLRKRW